MIIILMGVSGSGKSTIGRLLSERLSCPFFDGDDFHPPANIEKMSAGIPLVDRDRMAWIESIAERLNTEDSSPVVLACSALSSSIRQHLRKNLKGQNTFVHLEGDQALIAARLGERQSHFMPLSLLKSQFEALQDPRDDAIKIDIDQTPEHICQEILDHLAPI